MEGLTSETMKFLQFFLLSMTLMIVFVAVYFIGVNGQIHAPAWLLYFSLAYVFFQMIRIYRYGTPHYSDILYYLGAIVLALPEFSNNDELWFRYRWLVVFIVSSLLLKPVLDLIKVYRKS